MRIYIIEREKLNILACIFTCLCMAFILLHIYSSRKMNVDTFLTYSEADRLKSEKVELFGIEAGSVVGSFENSKAFRKEACKYLDSITGMYGNLKVFPKAGYIVKIPLDPPVKSSAKLLKAIGIESVDKIFVIFPSQSKPYLLLLDGQSKPFCFIFDAETTLLQKYVA